MSNIDLETIKQNVPEAWIPSLDSLIVKGSNAEIWDKDNNRYLDYVGGSEEGKVKFQKIIDYNEDDCIATRVIKDWLVSVT